MKSLTLFLSLLFFLSLTNANCSHENNNNTIHFVTSLSLTSSSSRSRTADTALWNGLKVFENWLEEAQNCRIQIGSKNYSIHLDYLEHGTNKTLQEQQLKGILVIFFFPFHLTLQTLETIVESQNTFILANSFGMNLPHIFDPLNRLVLASEISIESFYKERNYALSLATATSRTMDGIHSILRVHHIQSISLLFDQISPGWPSEVLISRFSFFNSFSF